MTTISADGQRRLAEQAGLDPDKATDTQAAVAVAESLMQGDPGTFKAGYTAPNALLAATEIFPDADRAEVANKLGIGCGVCGRDDLACRPLSGLPECCSREVVVIEDRVENHEFGPLVEGAKVLTANGAELPGMQGSIEGLIEHAVRTYPGHAIIVVAETEGEMEWFTAREWVEKRLFSRNEAAAAAAPRAKEVLDSRELKA